MDLANKIVTRLPLQELWRDGGFASTSRSRPLGESEIITFLRRGPVQFVQIDVGNVPKWIALRDCYEYWKNEVRPHLAHAGTAIIGQFPDGYCYFASEWDGGEAGVAIVVVEKHH
jgi:hypothetical protein